MEREREEFWETKNVREGETGSRGSRGPSEKEREGRKKSRVQSASLSLLFSLCPRSPTFKKNRRRQKKDQNSLTHRLETKGRWSRERSCGAGATPTRARGVMPPTPSMELSKGAPQRWPRRPSPFSKGFARFPRSLTSALRQHQPRPCRRRRRTSWRREREEERREREKKEASQNEKEFFSSPFFSLFLWLASLAPFAP